MVILVVATTIKRTNSNVGNTAGNGDAGQVAALLKRPISNVGDTIRNGNIG